MAPFFHPHALAGGNGDDVGEVNLALAVIGAHPAEGVEQETPVRQVDTGIDLADGPLLIGRVLLLDDGLHRAPGIDQDPAVAEGFLDQGTHQGEGRPVAAVDLDQRPQGLGADERRVAAEDEHQVRAGAGRLGAAHRVAGAQLFFLDHRGDRVTGQGRAHRLALVADDHRAAVGTGVRDRVEHVVDHRPKENLVEHLGALGLHSRTFAGGKDDAGD